RILVTGADGFTGLHFVQKARAAGHDIIEFTANLTDRAAVKSQVELAAPQAVVHLAGISFVGHDNPSAFYDVNVIGTLNLLDALQDLAEPPSRVLLASSANVYGNCDQSPIAETQAPAPVNHYAMSKLAMEYLAKTYADRLPLFFVRPFNYTGPGQAVSFVIPKLVEHFQRRAATVELGNLHIEREYNDVRMVCDVYLKLLERAHRGETYNICTGQTHTLGHVIDLLTELTGHRIEVQVNPHFARANEIHRLCGSPDKLIQTLGALPSVTLRDTLQSMLEAGPGPHVP
ncbi:MAG: GDP-mannose 4,6-dehydratase, partial [Undibacterium sp.]|uniref:GDP-mannose 4,6-dehydratase n=1 Tax=Undibacterium sp. TaxID=1914977 RepID=UPI00271C72ED